MDKRDPATDIVIDETNLRGELLGLPALVLHYEEQAFKAERLHRASLDLLQDVEARVRVEWWDRQCAAEVLDARVTLNAEVITARNDEAILGAQLGDATAALEGIRAKREALVTLVSAGLHARRQGVDAPARDSGGPF